MTKAYLIPEHAVRQHRAGSEGREDGPHQSDAAAPRSSPTSKDGRRPEGWTDHDRAGHRVSAATTALAKVLFSADSGSRWQGSAARLRIMANTVFDGWESAVAPFIPRVRIS